jgi:hypothetical protein
MSDIITGSGPSDPERREELQRSGWVPYSVKIGDTYVSFNRLDPMATILSVFGDMGDVLKYGAPDEQDGIENMGWATVVALASNMQSKSYLQGLIDLSDLLTRPREAVGETGGRIASAFVPWSSLLASARNLPGLNDDHIHEVRGAVDFIKSRIPVLNQTLDVQRNVIGEPIHRTNFGPSGRAWVDGLGFFLPIGINTTSSDVITNELAELNHGFEMPRRFRYGLDLGDIRNDKGQSAYDRWIELSGQVKVGGRTLRSSLTRLINSRDYQRLPAEGLGQVGIESPRGAQIQLQLRRYRAEALDALLKEFPQIREKARLQMVASRAIRSGQDPKAINASLFPYDK